MVKDNRGRKPLKIINSEAHARILFLIAQEKNYNQIISSELKTTPPATLEKIDILEKNKFITSTRLKRLNKKIYSVSYNKIINEFINFLKQQKQIIFSEIEKTHGKKEGLEWLKKNLLPYDFSNYDLLENKVFTEQIKENAYLHEYFKEVFKEISQQNLKLTLLDFFKFLLMRELFIEVLDDMRYFMARLQDRKKEYNNFEKRHEIEQKIMRDDKDLKNLKDFCHLLELCRKSVILELANSNALEKITNKVLFKNFDKTEVEDFLGGVKEHEQIFNENRSFSRVRKLLTFDEDYIDYKKNKLKILKNGINAPKPNEIKHKEDKEK